MKILLNYLNHLTIKLYKIGVCSSIRRTVLTTLSQIGLMEYCSVIMSNEDVKNENHILRCTERGECQ